MRTGTKYRFDLVQCSLEILSITRSRDWIRPPRTTHLEAHPAEEKNTLMLFMVSAELSHVVDAYS